MRTCPRCRAGATAYVGAGGSNAADAPIRIPITRGGVLAGMRADAGGQAPGASQSYTYTVMKEGVAGALTGAILNTDTSVADITNRTEVVPGDRLSVRVVASAGASALPTTSITLGFIPAGKV